jgi:hypothetical protein
LFLSNGCSIIWSSILQPTIALLALKTEYHTLVDATKGVDMVTHGTKGKKNINQKFSLVKIMWSSSSHKFSLAYTQETFTHSFTTYHYI